MGRVPRNPKHRRKRAASRPRSTRPCAGGAKELGKGRELVGVEQQCARGRGGRARRRRIPRDRDNGGVMSAGDGPPGMRLLHCGIPDWLGVQLALDHHLRAVPFGDHVDALISGP